MAISPNVSDLEKGKFVESSTVANQVTVAVTNADGSKIGSGNNAATVADGADVNAGATTDAANTTGTTGTMSGKLRGLVSILANVWDSVNGWLKVTLGTNIAGEDINANRLLVEARYSRTRLTASGLVATGAGYIKGLTFSATGAVTAGVVTVYDNTAASGDVIFSGVIQTGISPIPLPLETTFATGLYVSYDGTIANVATGVSWRQ